MASNNSSSDEDFDHYNEDFDYLQLNNDVEDINIPEALVLSATQPYKFEPMESKRKGVSSAIGAHKPKTPPV